MIGFILQEDYSGCNECILKARLKSRKHIRSYLSKSRKRWWVFEVRQWQAMGLERKGRFERALGYRAHRTSVPVRSYLSSVQSLSQVWLFVTHGLQHTRPPCPSPTPGVYSNSYPLHQWCHQLSHPLSFPSPASIFPSIRVFSNESVLCVRWPKYLCLTVNQRKW